MLSYIIVVYSKHVHVIDSHHLEASSFYWLNTVSEIELWSFYSMVNTYTILFDLMLYVHGKQLRSCQDCQLLNHTVPGQASQRQFTSTCI